MSAELKPCPFCGGEANVRNYETESLWSHNVVTYTQVGCSECDIHFDTEPGFEVEAPQAWNTRAACQRKRFPVLGSQGATVDWQLVSDHGKQARENHYQTVERLAERGGLSWGELYAVLHNRKWQKMDENDAIVAVRALEARYLEALEQAGNGKTDVKTCT